MCIRLRLEQGVDPISTELRKYGGFYHYQKSQIRDTSKLAILFNLYRHRHCWIIISHLCEWIHDKVSLEAQ